MKKLTKILSTTLIVAGLLTVGFTGRELFKAEPAMAALDSAKANTITSRGEGVVKVKPDIAYITMGVRTENKDAKVAQTSNAEKMDKVIAALKKMGIEEKDIQTSNYSVYPQYDYEAKGAEKIVGYVVDNTVMITVRDILKVGDVLDIGVAEGANVSNGIQFSISDTEKYYQEALKLAVKNARGKAEAMGEAIGVTLKNPSSIVEQSSGGSNIIYADRGVGIETAKMASTPISTGELDVRAMVEVSYQY